MKKLKTEHGLLQWLLLSHWFMLHWLCVRAGWSEGDLALCGWGRHCPAMLFG